MNLIRKKSFSLLPTRPYLGVLAIAFALIGPSLTAVSQTTNPPGANPTGADESWKNGVEEGMRMIGDQWIAAVELLRENNSRAALRLLRAMAGSVDAIGKNLVDFPERYGETRTLLPRMLVIDSTLMGAIKALDENDSDGAMDLMLSLQPASNPKTSHWDLPLSSFHRTLTKQFERATVLLREGNYPASQRLIKSIIESFDLIENLPIETDVQLQQALVRIFPLFSAAENALEALDEGDIEGALALIESF